MPRSVLLLALLATLLPGPASAAELRLEIADGFVTVVATDVPLPQILAEWARVGGTRIVNAERVAGPPVTLQLEKVPEQQALAVLLRSVAGYLAAPRRAGVPGASQYESVMILATSTPPAAAAAAARPPVNPGPFPPNRFEPDQPQLMPDEVDPIGSGSGFITVGNTPAPRQPTPAPGAPGAGAPPVPPMGSPFSQTPGPGMRLPNGPANGQPQQQPTAIQPGIIMPNGDILAEPEP